MRPDNFLGSDAFSGDFLKKFYVLKFFSQIKVNHVLVPQWCAYKLLNSKSGIPLYKVQALKAIDPYFLKASYLMETFHKVTEETILQVGL